MELSDAHLRAVLTKNETALWEGRQDLRSAIITSVTGIAFLLLFGSLFYYGFQGGTCTINGRAASIEECRGIANYIAYGIFALAILLPIGAVLNYMVTAYAVTNNRIIIKSGLIGADIRSIYHEQVRSIFVNVGVVGKVFGTGTILIDTGRMTATKSGAATQYDRLASIRNPYEVYNILQAWLSERKEGLHSGRADFESNKNKYKEYVEETERYRRNVK